MESLRPKIHKYNHKAYGRTKANAPCRKHPKHIQSPGVCSLCLNQKLSKLRSASSRAKRNYPSSSSSSSSYISSPSSSDGSSCSSPALNYAGSRSGKPTRLFKSIGQETLKKSRSMAFFMRRRREEEDGNGNGKNVEIRRGFWSKLLPRKIMGLTHSKTTRERVIVQ